MVKLTDSKEIIKEVRRLSGPDKTLIQLVMSDETEEVIDIYESPLFLISEKTKRARRPSAWLKHLSNWPERNNGSCAVIAFNESE